MRPAPHDRPRQSPPPPRSLQRPLPRSRTPRRHLRRRHPPTPLRLPRLLRGHLRLRLRAGRHRPGRKLKHRLQIAPPPPRQMLQPGVDLPSALPAARSRLLPAHRARLRVGPSLRLRVAARRPLRDLLPAPAPAERGVRRREVCALVEASVVVQVAAEASADGRAEVEASAADPAGRPQVAADLRAAAGPRRDGRAGVAGISKSWSPRNSRPTCLRTRRFPTAR